MTKQTVFNCPNQDPGRNSC